jgi:hypothetical protein
MKHLTMWIALTGGMTTVGIAQEDADLDRVLNRLKETVGLNEEQLAKVRDIVGAARKEIVRLEKEQEEKVRDLLTEEQKGKFEEALRFLRRRGDRGPGGREGGRGGGFGGMMERMLTPMADELGEQLDLAAEQKEKIRKTVDEVMEKARARMEEFRQGGFQGFNWQEEMEHFRKTMDDMNATIRGFLNEDQKPKFEKLLEERRRWMGGGEGTPTPGAGGREFGRRMSQEERLRRAMEVLKNDSEEETATRKAAVEKAMKAQAALSEHDRVLQEKIGAVLKQELSEEDLEKKLEELRGERKTREKELNQAQRELSVIVSYREELSLVALGVLK